MILYHFNHPVKIASPINSVTDILAAVSQTFIHMYEVHGILLHRAAEIYRNIKVCLYIEQFLKLSFKRAVQYEPHTAFVIVMLH